MKACSVEECERGVHGGGLCVMHYWRMKRSGAPGEAAPRSRHYASIEEKFIDQTARAGECIEWTGAKKTSGYGMICLGSAKVTAHRYAWERANGKIPDGLVIDHTCFNRACVNVEHLRLATVVHNCQNKEGPAKVSKSGIRNVHWAARERRWFVRMEAYGVKHYGGYFTDIKEAERRAIELRREVMPWSIR